MSDTCSVKMNQILNNFGISSSQTASIPYGGQSGTYDVQTTSNEDTTTSIITGSTDAIDALWSMVQDKLNLSSATSYISFLHFVVIVLAVLLVIFMTIAVVL